MLVRGGRGLAVVLAGGGLASGAEPRLAAAVGPGVGTKGVVRSGLVPAEPGGVGRRVVAGREFQWGRAAGGGVFFSAYGQRELMMEFAAQGVS